MKPIQFQTPEEIEEARRRHLKRTALIGGTAGAATFGGARYLLAAPYLGKKIGGIAALGGGIRGGLIGGATGLGIGYLTRPKKPKYEELSAKLDDLIEFITPRTKNILKTGAKIGGISVAGGAVGAGAYSVVRDLKRQRAWRESAGENDYLKIGPEFYIDKHGGMYPRQHPRLQNKNLTELSSKLDDLIQFQDPRNRNDLGQFTGAEGSPDPNAMEKTYRSGLHRGIVGGGVTAAVGGTSGVLATAAVKNIASRIRAAKKGKASRIILP